MLGVLALNIVAAIFAKYYYVWRNNVRQKKWGTMTQEERDQYLETTTVQGNKRYFSRAPQRTILTQIQTRLSLCALESRFCGKITNSYRLSSQSSTCVVWTQNNLPQQSSSERNLAHSLKMWPRNQGGAERC